MLSMLLRHPHTEWEIRYPLFGEAVLVDPSERVNRKKYMMFYSYALIMLCTFACMFVFCFTFGYFHHVCLCSPPLSGFSTRLRALINPFTTIWCAAFTRAFVCTLVCAPPLRGLPLCIRGLDTCLFVIIRTMRV
jgi:hypothetical protein